MSMAQAAVAAMNAALNATNGGTAATGGTIILSRPGKGSTPPLNCTYGRSVLATDDGAGGRIEAESNDFIVQASQIVLAGIVVTPLEGDTVVRTLQGITSTFRVTVPPYHPSDNGGFMTRIHTKLIGP